MPWLSNSVFGLQSCFETILWQERKTNPLRRRDFRLHFYNGSLHGEKKNCNFEEKNYNLEVEHPFGNRSQGEMQKYNYSSVELGGPPQVGVKTGWELPLVTVVVFLLNSHFSDYDSGAFYFHLLFAFFRLLIRQDGNIKNFYIDLPKEARESHVGRRRTCFLCSIP